MSPARPVFIACCSLLAGPLMATPFFAMSYGFRDMSPAEQTAWLAEAGYEGIAVHVWNDELFAGLAATLASEPVTAGNLTVVGAYFPYNLTNPHHRPLATRILEAGVPLWLAPQEPGATDEKVIALLRELAEEAAPLGLDVIYYPHDNHHCLDAEHAHRLIEAADRPNLFNSLHLHQELRAGNGHRLTEVIENVLPRVRLVSISGANLPAGVNQGSRDWSDVVQPLASSAFDAAGFYVNLWKAGYRGPVGVQNWKIPGDPRIHHAESLRLLQTWRDSVSKVSAHAIPVLDWSVETVSSGHGFTEGPAIAADGSVYFSDLDKGHILRFDPATQTTSIWSADSRKSNGLLIEGDTLYACEAAGRAVVQYTLSDGPESRVVLADRVAGKRFGSPNDLARVGDQLVFSSFYWKGILEPPDTAREIDRNRCYTLDLTSGSTTSIAHDFQTPNGVVFDSRRGRLYLGEMKENRIYVADVTAGSIGPTKLFIDLVKFEKGKPDGMAVDSVGRLYVALYGQSDELLIVAPNAEPLGVIPTGPKTSNCTLTADGNTLYLTAENRLKRIRLSWGD